MFPWESIPCLLNFPVSRLPSLALLRLRLQQYLTADAPRNPLRDGLDTKSAFYFINPSGDIQSTETLLTPKVDELRWEGVLGKKPSTAQFTKAVSSKGTSFCTKNENKKSNFD